MEAVAAEDPRTGLVLRHSEHEMPADRGVWRPRRPRVALAYDNNEETSQQLRGPRQKTGQRRRRRRRQRTMQLS